MKAVICSPSTTFWVILSFQSAWWFHSLSLLRFIKPNSTSLVFLRIKIRLRNLPVFGAYMYMYKGLVYETVVLSVRRVTQSSRKSSNMLRLGAQFCWLMVRFFDAPWSERSCIDLFGKETQNPFSDSFGFKIQSSFSLRNAPLVR